MGHQHEESLKFLALGKSCVMGLGGDTWVHRVLFQTLLGSVYLVGEGHLALKGRVHRGRNILLGDYAVRASDSLTLLLGMGRRLARPADSLEKDRRVACPAHSSLPPPPPLRARDDGLLGHVRVSALGSALLSVSRLNCHPGNG